MLSMIGACLCFYAALCLVFILLNKHIVGMTCMIHTDLWCAHCGFTGSNCGKMIQKMGLTTIEGVKSKKTEYNTP